MTSSSSEHTPRRTKHMRHRHSTHNHPSRRRRHKRRPYWHTQNLARLAASVGFVLLVLYEFFVLRGAFTPRHLASVTAIQHPPTQPPPQPPPKPVSAPVVGDKTEGIAVADGDSTRERIRAAAHLSVKTEQQQEDGFKPPLKLVGERAEAENKTENDEEKKQQQDNKDSIITQREKDAAILQKLESRAADADDEAEPPTEPKKPTRVERKPSHETQREKTSTRPTGGDVEPPKPRIRRKSEERGAEPGAGENFWQWFQDTKGSEKGEVASGLNCPADYERLCKMVFKYLRKYKIRALFDVGCSNNLDWISGVLKKIGNELWGFKYYCGEPDADRMATAKESLSSLGFVEFIPDEWWRVGFPEDTELLLAWDVLPHIAYGRIWNFFVKAKAQDVKYVLIDNYPGIMNDPSPKRNYLNVRKHPFRFPAAKEVVQNVTEPGETAKRQLLFYESSMLPDNLQ